MSNGKQKLTVAIVATCLACVGVYVGKKLVVNVEVPPVKTAKPEQELPKEHVPSALKDKQGAISKEVVADDAVEEGAVLEEEVAASADTDPEIELKLQDVEEAFLAHHNGVKRLLSTHFLKSLREYQERYPRSKGRTVPPHTVCESLFYGSWDEGSTRSETWVAVLQAFSDTEFTRYEVDQLGSLVADYSQRTLHDGKTIQGSYGLGDPAAVIPDQARKDALLERSLVFEANLEDFLRDARSTMSTTVNESLTSCLDYFNLVRAAD